MTDDEQPAGPRAAGVNQAAIDWAWAQPIANNPGARVALLCLARRVDETWECTASQEEVAMDAMVPARSMRRYLDQLEEGGFIARVKRVDDRGHRLPGAIRLNPSSGPLAKLATGRDQGQRHVDGQSRSSEPVAKLAGGRGAYRPDWPVGAHSPSSEPVAILASGSDQAEHSEDERSRRSRPLANMAGGQQRPEAGDPPANLASGSDQQNHPVANLAGGQGALWSDPENKQNARSDPVANLAGGESRTINSSSSKKKNKKNPSSSEIRDDVEQLCSRLHSWLIKKDYRGRPDEVLDTWRREARLLLDKDGVAFDEALAVLDWSQRDQFWHKNINSMPTFRAQYGRLELQSRGVRGDAPAAATGTTNQRPAPLPPRVGGYENARNFGRKRS